MDLSRINKEDLEDILCVMLDETKKCEIHLFHKFSDMLDDLLYDIDKTEAIDIVHSFEPNGEAFSMEKVEDIITRIGISHDCLVDYYLTMNMFYNDFKPYVENKRLDMQEFCIEMSKLFINDVDAPNHKVSKYFKMYLDDNIEDEE